MKLVAAASCVAGLMVVLIAPSAWATQWSSPVADSSIALPFGAEYSGVVHRGIDLPAASGAEVRAPSTGRITFAGTIPADGGGTCNAVTIETADGLKISLLPLEGVYVQAGSTVSAGDAVGRLAGAGDDSTDAPHLHMGLRQGDRYIDPAPMLPGLSVGGSSGPVPDVEPPVVVTDPAPAPTQTAVVPAAIPAQAPAQASGQAASSNGAEIQFVTSIGAAVPSGAVAPSVSGEAAAPGPVAARVIGTRGRSREERLLSDAGISRSAVPVTDDASGVTRWVSGRTGRTPALTSGAALLRAVVTLAAAAGGLMPIIARSKVLVRVR